MRRRAVLAAGAVLALAGGIGTGPAWAEGVSQRNFSGIRVDVQALISRGGGAQALVLRDDLTAALRAEFADRIGSGGPALVVRITGLSINPYAGGEGGRGRFGGGGGQSDYLDGEALLVGRRGEILARHPQLSALPASSGGAWYDPESERRRVAALAQHYAAWLRRGLPGD